MAEVWTRSASTGAARLVLLALADCADAEKREAWPSLTHLAQKTKLSLRGVRYALRGLEQLGELETRERSGTSAVYRLTPGSSCPPAHIAPRQPVPPTPANDDRNGGGTPATLAPYPSVREPSVKRKRRTQRAKLPETEWPDDFVLTPERREAARAAGCLDPPLAWEAWHQRCLAKGLRYARWGAAWITWLSNHGRYGCPCQKVLPLRGGRPTTMDGVQNLAAKYVARGQV